MNSLHRSIKSYIVFQYYAHYKPRATLMITSKKIAHIEYNKQKITCSGHMKNRCNV